MSDKLFEKLFVRRAAGKIYLLDKELEGGRYHKPVVINEIGEEMFTLLAEGHDVPETAEIMAGRYEVESSMIEADVNAFISDIKKQYKYWE